MSDRSAVAASAPDRTARPHRFRGLVGSGFAATVVAMVATFLTAALARAAGVELEVPAGGETIPLPGVATMTGLCSVLGIALAAALLRWSADPDAGARPAGPGWVERLMPPHPGLRTAVKPPAQRRRSGRPSPGGG